MSKKSNYPILESSDDEEEYPDDNENINKYKKVPTTPTNTFIGTNTKSKGWLQCIYCEKYQPTSMRLPGLQYCGHCWAWLNSNQLDLEKGIYLGENSITDVKNYLKDTFKLHDSKQCKNKECIYNRIIDLKNSNKLHIDFLIELGFYKEKKSESSLNKSANETINTNTNNSYKINHKTISKINYKLSHIII